MVAWRLKAIEVLDAADLEDAIELLIEFSEIERLARRVDKATHFQLMKISHYCTQPVAEVLTKGHPLLAAKVYRALGMRILESKKAKYYFISHAHFERAKKLYEQAGHPEEWQEVVSTVLTNHKRKSSFIDGFKRIAIGESQNQLPTFQERIKNRLNRYS